MKWNKTHISLLIILILSFPGFYGFAHTPEQQKEIDKILRMQDSIMHTPEYKAVMKKIEEISDQVEKSEKKLQQGNQNVKPFGKNQPAENTEINQINKNPASNALISKHVQYSATSYLQSKNSGNNFGTYKSRQHHYLERRKNEIR